MKNGAPLGDASYDVSKAEQLSNPMDANSPKTGKTIFILNEMYESMAGVADHFERTPTWSDFPALGAWLGECELVAVPGAPISNSRW